MGMRVWFFLWASLGLGCSVADTEPETETRLDAPNLILISIDTLRSDHLGCYGYNRPTSPALDRLCEDSVVYSEAIAQAPSTLHSHASIFTSLIPHHHGASWGGRTRLADECLTLAEVAQEAGMATGAFTGGGQMDKIFGLDQGFDSYNQPGTRHFYGTVKLAEEWLAERPDRPFFLFLHTYETHHPYEPQERFLEIFDDDYDGELPDVISVDMLKEINRKKRVLQEGDLQHIVNTYDAEIRSMDEALEHLIVFLRENSLYDDTMIVFTSDHGEEFGEHGRVGWHSHSLYDELLRVPLVIKFPNQHHAGARVSDQVSSIDIAPTVLSALGLPTPEDFQGRDIAPPAVGGEGGGRAVISRIDRKLGKDIDSIRQPDWKLYRGQLFDLQADPEELWDTALNKPRILEQLRTELDSIVGSRDPCLGDQVVPTGATLDELKALGYLQ
ncbi:MAG: sulfatase [bacterium]|nr:sulfatase [bacterium]